MRLIGEIENGSLAKRFASFLYSEGISVKVEPEGEQFEIWVKDEDKLEIAATELDEFKANPEASKYQGAVEKARQMEREALAKRKRVEKNVVHIAQKGGGSSKSRPLTILLIVICGIVALLSNFGDDKNFEDPLVRALLFASISQEDSKTIIEDENKKEFDEWNYELWNIKKGEIWRLITPMFLHFGPMHLIFNMIMLFQLGQLIENRYGTLYLAMLVLFCAVLSNTAQQLAPIRFDGSAINFTGEYIQSMFAGMSGVVYGLFGYVWLKSSLDPNAGFRINQSAVMILIVWMFLGMTPFDEQWLGIRMANWAHAVGLLAGLLFAYVALMLKK